MTRRFRRCLANGCTRARALGLALDGEGRPGACPPSPPLWRTSRRCSVTTPMAWARSCRSAAPWRRRSPLLELAPQPQTSGRLAVGDSVPEPRCAGRDLQRQAWQWAQANGAGDGSLPSGRQIARQYDRHERVGAPRQALRLRWRVQRRSRIRSAGGGAGSRSGAPAARVSASARCAARMGRKPGSLRKLGQCSQM